MKELPVRKRIRLDGCDYSDAGAYFVMICVKDGHELLGEVVHPTIGDARRIVPYEGL